MQKSDDDSTFSTSFAQSTLNCKSNIQFSRKLRSSCCGQLSKARLSGSSLIMASVNSNNQRQVVNNLNDNNSDQLPLQTIYEADDDHQLMVDDHVNGQVIDGHQKKSSTLPSLQQLPPFKPSSIRDVANKSPPTIYEEEELSIHGLVNEEVTINADDDNLSPWTSPSTPSLPSLSSPATTLTTESSLNNHHRQRDVNNNFTINFSQQQTSSSSSTTTHVQSVSRTSVNTTTTRKRRPLSLIQLTFVTIITAFVTSGQFILPVTSVQMNQFSAKVSKMVTDGDNLMTAAAEVSKDGHEQVQSEVVSKCDFDKYPSAGCSDHLTSICDMSIESCVCRTGYPIIVNGRCFALREISELCVSSRQCIKVKGRCIDNNNSEVNENINLTNFSNNNNQEERKIRLSVGICKCADNLQFYNLDRRECMTRILGKKCFFNTDCYSRSHSYCDGSKCKCKIGFFHDLINDECKPSLVTLCIYGSIIVNGTQKCKPSPRIVNVHNHGNHENNNNILDNNNNIINTGLINSDHPVNNNHRNQNGHVSALFWPVIAFFLVILLLRMLKEGMKRDCERALGGNNLNSDDDGHHQVNYNRRRTRSSSSLNGTSRSGGGHRRSASSNHHNFNGGQSLAGPRVSSMSRPYIRHYPIDGLNNGSNSVAQIGSGVPLPIGTIDLSRSVDNMILPGTRGLIDGTSGHPEIIVLMPPPPYTEAPSRNNNINNVNNNDGHNCVDGHPGTSGTINSSNSTTGVIIPEEPPSYEEATRK